MLKQLGATFIPAVANRARELLAALNEIAGTFRKGEFERHRELCTKWLTSERFSDASNQEKNERGARMTFKHPCYANTTVKCYWHGKIRTAVYRLHFEWPPPFVGRRLFIAYLGPKLTKQ
jgi:hypothetical protein